MKTTGIMKCDNCEHKRFHPPGSYYDVIEGGDDPYAYDYCGKYHWIGDGSELQDESQVGMEDPWINCTDFKQQKP